VLHQRMEAVAIVESVKVVDDVDPMTGEGGGIKADDDLPDVVVNKHPNQAVVVDGALPPLGLAHALPGLSSLLWPSEILRPCAEVLCLLPYSLSRKFGSKNPPALSQMSRVP
jgi:hypothetical protein